ncbi:hypothetical protein EJ04DRAFT_517432 [Polyplosphaeria fusca]|uniref:Uncharacterized protein n=1 Tax=Polyplosphaeria fusca TaxID=682080 RepID=A0A9P4QLX2_9PLEO|nr:hypothetical protein EJ04DRAFT_517432 [Polyplosphaeria fusca]
MLKTAKETVASYRRSSPDYTPAQEGASDETKPLSESETEDFGPVPLQNTDNRRAGPTVPRLGDLDHRNELREEDRARERSDYIDDIRYERKVDRKAQKERLEEYMPRADPGSRERQLEKKRETTSTLKDFRDAKEGGDAEMAEADVMGDDGIEVYKRKKMETERKKTEREIRKEEVFRAKAAEREERLAERRAKEASTMEYFQKLAKERFG